MINSLAGSNPQLDALARFVVNDYLVPTTLCLLLVTLWFEAAPEASANRRAVLRTVTAVLIANLLVKIFNMAYFRPRPFYDMNAYLLFYRPADPSFPSNPAAVGFAFAGAVWPQNRTLGRVMAFLATLFSLARVYVGVQYPLDVIGGGILGLFAASISIRLDARLQPVYQLAMMVAQRLGVI